MTQSFVHLRVHTEYALVDGTVRIKPLIDATRTGGMPAVATSDLNNLFGLVKFYKAATARGIKPIVACDVWVEDLDPTIEPSLLVLIAQRQAGYKALSRLLSRGYSENHHNGRMILKRSWIQADSEGLLALSAAADGDVGKAIVSGQLDEARRRAVFWQALFPDGYYLEIQRLDRANDEHHIAGAVQLSDELGLPLVATNDVRFLKADEFEAHEVRVCIHQGRTLDDPRREKRYSQAQYFKSADEMAQLFSDLPEAVENTHRIATRCSVTLRLGESFLPEYPVPDGQTMAGMRGRLNNSRVCCKISEPTWPKLSCKCIWSKGKPRGRHFVVRRGGSTVFVVVVVKEVLLGAGWLDAKLTSGKDSPVLFAPRSSAS